MAAADSADLGRRVADLARDVRPEDEFVVIYTSGTTANPRGCVHTHESVVRQGASLAERIGLGEGDRFWTPLPFFHVGGFDVLFASLSAQAVMIHAGQFEPGAALAQLTAERVTHAFPAFETIWMPVLNHPDFPAADLSRLTTVINVGTPERMRFMQDRLPAAVQISCTGSTEGAGFVCVGDPADPPEARALWAGASRSAGMEARIVDPKTGADLPDRTPGEFVFRGVSRFARYYRDPRTTADRIDGDGWYHSGDLLERDEAGRFRFHSRLSDVLKVGGENVSAAEVEDRIAALPGVAVVQVVGGARRALRRGGRGLRGTGARRLADRGRGHRALPRSRWRPSRSRATCGSSASGRCPAPRSRKPGSASGSRTSSPARPSRPPRAEPGIGTGPGTGRSG